MSPRMTEGRPCEYCGTTLETEPEQDDREAATGEYHYVSKCREYVTAAKNAYARDLAAMRAEVEELREKLGVRCPSCLKMVAVDAGRIRSHEVVTCPGSHLVWKTCTASGTTPRAERKAGR